MDDELDKSNLTSIRQYAEIQTTIPSLEEAGKLNLLEIQKLIHELQVHQVELEIQNEELRKTQQILMASRDKYSHLYDAAPVGYCTLNEQGVVLECNHMLLKLFGVGRDKLLRYTLGQYIDPKDRPILSFMLSQGKDEIEHEVQLSTPDGKATYVLIRLHRIGHDVEFTDSAWMAAISDVTAIHQMTMELKVKSRAIETTMEGVVITNHRNEICYVNPAFEETTGYRSEEVIGKSPNLMQSGKHTQSFYADMWGELRTMGKWRGEIWNRRASGEIYPEWLSISTIYDEKQKPLYYVGVFSDITHEEEVRQRLHQLAYFDNLTNLPNRHLFMDRLSHELTHARRHNSSFVLMFMDLDRFKSINDSLGHTVGDLLLVEVSKRLQQLLRENDTIARMGGDEFMILLPEVESVSHTNLVAEKILNSMAEPFDLEGSQYHISISIGISRYPEDGLDAEKLIKSADIAMYQAKDKGRNTFSNFNSSLNRKAHKLIEIDNDLRNALNHGQLELHYQPQRELQTDSWSGVEALLRWNHPEKGIIQPEKFIPIAEETGLIVNIGYWVLRTAAKQYLKWKTTGVDVGTIAINLSPHQFMQSNLVENIKGILEETGMPPEKLGIELTESAAMPNFQYSITTLKSLQEMGITIYIDDFGTGFSSLSHLRHLPIDALKIPRQFIDEIPSNPDDVAIAKSIIAMAKSLNLQIVAEGVETEEQLNFLNEEGCQIIQGFFFSEPVRPSQVSQLLKI